MKSIFILTFYKFCITFILTLYIIHMKIHIIYEVMDSIWNLGFWNFLMQTFVVLEALEGEGGFLKKFKTLYNRIYGPFIFWR